MQHLLKSLSVVLTLAFLFLVGCSSVSDRSTDKSLLSKTEKITPEQAIEGLLRTIIEYNRRSGVAGLNLKMYFPPPPPHKKTSPNMRIRHEQLKKKSDEINEKIDAYWKERRFVIRVIVDKSLCPAKEMICEGFKVKIENTLQRQERIYHNASLFDLVHEYELLLANPVVIINISEFRELGARRFYMVLDFDYGIPQTNVTSEVFLVRTKKWEIQKVKAIGFS